jgi:hypothetical protein
VTGQPRIAFSPEIKVFVEKKREENWNWRRVAEGVGVAPGVINRWRREGRFSYSACVDRRGWEKKAIRAKAIAG